MFGLACTSPCQGTSIAATMPLAYTPARGCCLIPVGANRVLYRLPDLPSKRGSVAMLSPSISSAVRLRDFTTPDSCRNNLRNLIPRIKKRGDFPLSGGNPLLDESTWVRNPEVSRLLLSRHRLNGYLAQRVRSLYPASSFRKCLDCEVLKGMFPWRTRYPLSRCRLCRGHPRRLAPGLRPSALDVQTGRLGLHMYIYIYNVYIYIYIYTCIYTYV